MMMAMCLGTFPTDGTAWVELTNPLLDKGKGSRRGARGDR